MQILTNIIQYPRQHRRFHPNSYQSPPKTKATSSFSAKSFEDQSKLKISIQIAAKSTITSGPRVLYVARTPSIQPPGNLMWPRGGIQYYSRS